MKIAVTSQNFRTITGHAGKTRRFIIYETDNNRSAAEVDRLDLPKEMSMHAFQGEEHPIDGVDYLITQSCGPGFIAKLKQRGIEVIVSGESDPLTAVKTLLNSL